MVLRFRSVLWFTVFCLTSAAGLAQAPGQVFSYVFPRVTGEAGTNIFLTNTTGSIARVEVFFLKESGEQAGRTVVELSPGTQTRITPAALGTLPGAAVVVSTSPISASAALAEGSGAFEVLTPFEEGRELLIPFARGLNVASTELAIFNPNPVEADAFITLIGPDGTRIVAIRLTLPAFGSLHQTLDQIFSGGFLGATEDISHILVQAPSSVLQPPRPLVASAFIRGFSARSQGVRTRTDPATVRSVPVESLGATAMLPLVVQGGDFFTFVQVVNTSNRTQAVTLFAGAPDGSLIQASNNPATFGLPANSSLRRTAQEVFGFRSTDMVTGSIFVQGEAPLTATAAIGNFSQPSFVIIPAAGPAGTNFAFQAAETTREFFLGLSFLNPVERAANTSLTFLSNDGTTISQARLTVPGFGQVTQTLAELLPEAQGSGFVLVTSDSPLNVTGLTGRVDGTTLGNVQLPSSSPSFQPPPQTKFLAVGAVRSGGAPLAGANVLLSGPIFDAKATDGAGIFVFRDVPAGSYTLTARAAGFTFTPSEISFAISDTNSRDNNFSGALVIPQVTTVAPASVVVDSPPTDVTITGGPFISTSEVLLDGIAVPTVVVNETTVRARLDRPRLAVPRTGSISVRNRGPAGDSAVSESRTFVVGNPAPTLAGLAGLPRELVAGNPGFTMTVSGSSFMQGASVLIDGVARQTTFSSPSSVSVAVPGEALGSGGNLRVTALNPSPTVGPSNSLALTVLNPIPGVLSISPNSAEVRLEVNAPPLQLSVNGFGFKAGAAVQVAAGSAIVADFISSTQLRASVPASLLMIGGVVPVSVRNPEPTLAGSEAVPLFLTNLVPVLSAVDAGVILFDPRRTTETFTAPVILTGANFGANSIAVVGTPCRPGAQPTDISGVRISSSQLIVTVPIECTGTYSVSVKTPQPGGGSSIALPFTVSPLGVAVPPSITSLSPTAVGAGIPTFNVTITGSNFANGLLVNFGTTVLPPLSLSATQVVVAVPAYLVRERGVIPVTVTNPGASGTSNRILFQVN